MTDPGAQPRPARARDILLVAIWFGLLTGLAELALLAAAKVVLHRYLHMSALVAWMTPVLYAAAFAVLALPPALGARLAPGRPWLRAVTMLCGFVGALGILFLFHRLHVVADVVLATGLAIVASDLIARRQDRFLRLVRWSLVPLALAVVAVREAVVVSRARHERRAMAALPPAPHAPNVLLIVLDAVRAQDLGVYGHARGTTPVLERLAARSIVFDRAIAPSSWTLPSHASMMTGLWADATHASWNTPLRGDVPTLAEALAARGYQTGGFVANTYYLGRESGVQRGFARWEAVRESFGSFVLGSELVRRIDQDHDGWRLRLRRYQMLGRKGADRINREFLGWLDDREPDRPFFAFLNYYDAHDPYIPSPPYDTLFGRVSPGFIPMLWRTRDPSPPELRDLQLAYDQSITELDHHVGALLDTLAARGLLDSTLVIVTSDHGEEFGEHGLIQHGYSLYLPSLRIPLLVSLPGRIPQDSRVRAWVSTRDLPATILDLTGSDTALLPGRSLARFWSGADTTADTLHAELRHAGGLPARFPVSQGDLTSALGGGFQFIATGAARRELYDLAADSLQRHDLAADSASHARVLGYQDWLDRLAARSTPDRR